MKIKLSFKKICIVLFSVVILSMQSMNLAYANQYTKPDYKDWTKLETKTGVSLTKDWTINFNSNVTFDKIDGVTIEGDNIFIPVDTKIMENKTINIKPMKAYKPNSDYNLRIFLSNGKRYVLPFKTVEKSDEVILPEDPKEKDVTELPWNRGTLLKIAPNPTKGFNYPYFMYIPQTINKSDTNSVIFECNNTAVHKENITEYLAEEQVTNSDGYRIAERTGNPLVFPSFPRPSDGKYAFTYTHYINRRTMLIPKDEKLGRVDLQAVAMIKDAQSRLKDMNIKTKPKAIACGASASAHFSQRLAILHPEMIDILAVGAINSLPTLPISSLNGTELRFPVGISDIQQLTGQNINIEEYKKVKQYIYMGDSDTNDTAPYYDCYDKQETDAIYAVLGKKQVPDRFNKVKEVYAQNNLQAQFVLYKNTGHQGAVGLILNDVVNFINRNEETDKLVEITPTEYPNGNSLYK